MRLIKEYKLYLTPLFTAGTSIAVASLVKLNIISFFICLLISFALNILCVKDTIKDAIFSNTEPIDSNKNSLLKKAKYPPINPDLVNKRNEGFIFGKTMKNNGYVAKKVEEDGHIFIIGGSGSGKSSNIIIPTLISNPDIPKFVIDIKGELSLKSEKRDKETIRIINPEMLNAAYGYDPFYQLDEFSSQKTINETMKLIAISLIPLPATVQDPFWKQSARILLEGLMLFYYYLGLHDFVLIMQTILSVDIKTAVKMAMEKADKKSACYRNLTQFSDMAQETISSVFAEMASHLTIFANDEDIIFAFRTNTKKTNPKDLLSGKSIYLSISEHKLAPYYDVLQLILNQTLGELEKRPEGQFPIYFIIDELPRILSAGKIEKLLDGARTLRSRKVTLCMVTQSKEALESAYTQSEVEDLLTNCAYKVILSTDATQTQQAVVSWVGKYKEIRQNYNNTTSLTRTKTTNQSYSYEDKDILDPSELITLPKKKELILISPYGYNRIKTCPYYKEESMANISADAKAYNEKLSSEYNSEKNNDIRHLYYK